jgi:hypothetical protein
LTSASHLSDGKILCLKALISSLFDVSTTHPQFLPHYKSGILKINFYDKLDIWKSLLSASSARRFLNVY